MCEHRHCPQMLPSVWVIGNIFVLVAANVISVLWYKLLLLRTYVCCCVKPIQVKLACCAFITSPPPPCGWVPCRRLCRRGMVATALSVVGVVGEEDQAREHHQLRRLANPSCNLTDPALKRLIITRRLMSYLAGEHCQAVWYGSTFHVLPEQSLTLGPPSAPQQHSRRAHQDLASTVQHK